MLFFKCLLSLYQSLHFFLTMFRAGFRVFIKVRHIAEKENGDPYVQKKYKQEEMNC